MNDYAYSTHKEQLCANEYDVVPVKGKRPLSKGWQKHDFCDTIQRRPIGLGRRLRTMRRRDCDQPDVARGVGTFFAFDDVDSRGVAKVVSAI